MSKSEKEIKTIAKLIEANMKKRHFNNELGLEIETFDNEDGDIPTASFLYSMKEDHLNNYDALHGGIVASIFDVAMGLGSAALTKSMVTTADMSFSFLHPARGREFRIIVEYGHVGKNLVNCSAKLYAINDGDEKDLLCATALGNYFVLGMPLISEA